MKDVTSQVVTAAERLASADTSKGKQVALINLRKIQAKEWKLAALATDTTETSKWSKAEALKRSRAAAQTVSRAIMKLNTPSLSSSAQKKAVARYTHAQKVAISEGIELRKAAGKSKKTSARQNIELQDTFLLGESSTNSDLQDIIMAKPLDLHDVSQDPDVSKEEKRVMDAASELKKQIKHTKQTQRSSLEIAASSLDKRVQKTDAKAQGPCTLSKSNMEEMCADNKSSKVCIRAKQNYKTHCLHTDQTNVEKAQVAKAHNAEGAEDAKNGPEDQALKELGNILQEPPTPTKSVKKVEAKSHQDKIYAAADQAAKASAAVLVSTTSSETPSVQHNTPATSAQQSNTAQKEHPIVTALQQSDSELKKMQQQVSAGQTKLSESYSKLEKEKTDLSDRYDIAKLGDKSKERSEKLKVLHDKWETRSKVDSPRDKMLHYQLNQANKAKVAEETEVHDIKAAYDAKVEALATESAQKTADLAKTKQQAEEATQDAKNTKQTAALAESKLARRASRSISAMRREEQRIRKSAKVEMTKVQTAAQEEVTRAKRDTQRKVGRAQREANRAATAANSTVTNMDAKMHVTAALEEVDMKEFAAKSSQAKLLAGNAAGNATAKAATGNTPQAGTAQPEQTDHVSNAKAAVEKWSGANAKAEAEAREKEHKSTAKLATAKELSTKQIEKAKIKAKMAVASAEQNKKDAHEATKKAAKQAKHAAQVASSMNGAPKKE